MHKKYKDDLSGKKFNKLKVIGYHSIDKFRRSIWLCECECGNRRLTPRQPLVAGLIKSCGCSAGNKGKQAHNFCGHKEISGAYWCSIKHGAKRRKLDFDIDLEYAWSIFEKQDKKCAMSGLPLTFARQYIVNGHKEQSASLDRINSSKGYVVDNVQWVHKRINGMKMKSTNEEFLDDVKMIYEFKNLHEKAKSIHFC